MEKISNESESFDVVNLNEVPEDAPLIHFDTMEDFEKALKELEEEQKLIEEAEVVEEAEVIEEVEIIEDEETAQDQNSFPKTEAELIKEYYDSVKTPKPVDLNPGTINIGDTTTAAVKTTSVRHKVRWARTYNPLLIRVRPYYVTSNVKYSYTGTGSSKKYSSIKNVTSYSPFSFPHDWNQTDYNHSFYNLRKGVIIKLIGYHIIGVNVGGQAWGARVSDSLKYRTTVGSTAPATGTK